MSDDSDIAFPLLSSAEIDALRHFGSERAMATGEVLFAEGDRGFCFFVVLSGEVEIVEHSGETERTVATHSPGHFTGDVDMLSGRSALVTGRARLEGRVLQIGAEALRRAVQELPDLGERILKAFLTRRSMLLGQGFAGLRIIGSRFSPEAHRLRDFAARNQVPFTWIDLERDVQAEALLRHFGIEPSATPVVIGHDGVFLTRPSVAELAKCVGLDAAFTPDDLYDLVVVGAGPAGLAASVYASSEGLKTLTFDESAAGGQAGTSARIENYLGFPTGISGADLTRNALLQAQRFGARISVPDKVVRLRIDNGNCVLVDRVNGIANVVIHRGCQIAAVAGDRHLGEVTLRYDDARELKIPTAALFMFIGAAPHTEWLTGCLQLDAKGFVLTGGALSPDALDNTLWKNVGHTPSLLETSLPGVFAAGDVRSGSMKRVASAVGEGAMAVSLVHAHIGLSE